MNFLYPSFLFGLFAVGIPVIIHLFNFQKPRQVLFTNVKFLKTVQESTTSARKLKHILILISRILFVIFLVLAFAQPFLEKKHGLTNTTQNVAVYLDNSLSMEIDEGGEKALDESVKSVQSLTDFYKLNSKYFLVTNDFEGKDQFDRNHEKFTERLSEINYSPVHRSLNQIDQRQNSFLKSRASEKYNIFWFSDFQKSTSGDLSKIKFDSLRNYILVPVQKKTVPNLFIDSVFLSEPLVKAGQNNILNVSLVNTGTKDASNVGVRFLLNGTQFGYTTTSIPAGNKGKVQFSFSLSESTRQQGLIQIEDNAYKFDNQHYFVLNPDSRINLYHLYAGQGRNINNLYSNEEAFNLESSEIGQVDYSKIEESNLLVLDGLSEYSSGLIENCRSFVEKGGSLVVFPGKNSEISKLNNLIAPLQVSESKVDTSQKKEYELEYPDLRNPFFKDVFEKNEKGVQMPYALPNIKTGNAYQVLLRYKNGTPFLSLWQNGSSGKIYLFSSSLDPDLTNFYKHSYFVPVMYKIAFNSMNSSTDLSYTFQNSIISVRLQDKPEVNTVFTLEGAETRLIPGQRLIDKTLQIEVPRDKMKAGFYKLKTKEKEYLLAFNYSPEESSMEFYTPQELKNQFAGNKNVTVFEVENSEDFRERFKNENIGTPLWKYCLILALVFLLTEILLIRFLK
jgi:hypothetical protein